MSDISTVGSVAIRSASNSRVFGDNENVPHACYSCESYKAIERGAGSGSKSRIKSTSKKINRPARAVGKKRLEPVVVDDVCSLSSALRTRASQIGAGGPPVEYGKSPHQRAPAPARFIARPSMRERDNPDSGHAPRPLK